jgi:hypothetical protein
MTENTPQDSGIYEAPTVIDCAVSPEKLAEQIKDVKSVYELVEVLRNSGGIQGSKRFYTPDELIVSLAGDPMTVTSSLGLRQKVVELINNEERKKWFEIPKLAVLYSDADWKMNFNGIDGLRTMDEFRTAFPNIKTTGWVSAEGPIDGDLLWTNGDLAIFEKNNGVKFMIHFKAVRNI